VIHVTPTHVDYGTIPVLTGISKIVQLSNESLIPAQFSCNMVSYWLKGIIEKMHATTCNFTSTRLTLSL